MRSPAPSPDALVSMYTPFKFSTPISSAGPVRGTHATGHHDAGAQSLSDGSRTLLGFQIFAWNIAFVGSLVVPTVFWTVLVRRIPLCLPCTSCHACTAVAEDATCSCLLCMLPSSKYTTRFEVCWAGASFRLGLLASLFGGVLSTWIRPTAEEQALLQSCRGNDGVQISSFIHVVVGGGPSYQS